MKKGEGEKMVKFKNKLETEPQNHVENVLEKYFEEYYRKYVKKLKQNFHRWSRWNKCFDYVQNVHKERTVESEVLIEGIPNL